MLTAVVFEPSAPLAVFSRGRRYGLRLLIFSCGFHHHGRVSFEIGVLPKIAAQNYSLQASGNFCSVSQPIGLGCRFAPCPASELLLAVSGLLPSSFCYLMFQQHYFRGCSRRHGYVPLCFSQTGAFGLVISFALLYRRYGYCCHNLGIMFPYSSFCFPSLKDGDFSGSEQCLWMIAFASGVTATFSRRWSCPELGLRRVIGRLNIGVLPFVASDYAHGVAVNDCRPVRTFLLADASTRRWSSSFNFFQRPVCVSLPVGGYRHFFLFLVRVVSAAFSTANFYCYVLADVFVAHRLSTAGFCF